MLRCNIKLNSLPILRPFAAEVSALSNRFSSTITLEHENLILNLKSMIGLLSQQLPQNGELTLVADGEDEAEAIAAVSELLNRK